MTVPTTRTRRVLSSSDKAILAIHALVAIGVGLAGVLGATDPGWGDLQRVVVAMLTAVWLGGVAASGVIARLVNARWLRLVVLLAGPVVALVVVVWTLR